MIERLEIRNLKRFGELVCTLPEHLVITGPNNCGKTTLLQAIAFWSEMATRWAEYNPDLSRDADGNYPGTELNLLRISSIPLADWDHLWLEKAVNTPVSIRLQIDGVTLGFELVYGSREIAHVRPTKDVSESALEQFLREPLIPIYIPPMSGVDRQEPTYGPEVIRARLARAQAGTVLRNMLLGVSTNPDNWQELRGIIARLFGYELTFPSAGAEILAGYCERRAAPSLDYSNGAAGFLQIVMIYAAIFQRHRSVILIDEPDAHLHIYLQERLYRDLRQRSMRHGWQLIIATHSERMIREARTEDLRLLSGKLYEIQKTQGPVGVPRLSNSVLLEAHHKKRILYLEGETDLKILRAWAAVLEHSLCQFLEEPFWQRNTEDKWKAVRHFEALRLNVPSVRGVELRDRNHRGEGIGRSERPEGLRLLVWERFEIENYLRKL